MRLFNTTRKRYFILFFLTLSISGMLGFFIGAFPEIVKSIRGYSPDQILLLSSSPHFPPQLLQEYQRKSGKFVNLKVIESYHLFKTEAQRADLIFAPLAWVNGFEDFLVDNLDDPQLLDLQASDFRTAKINLKHFVPATWQINVAADGTQSLQIFGFAVPIESAGTPLELIRFLTANSEHLQLWGEVIPNSFTFEKTDQIQNLDEKKKAAHIRSYPLSQIRIETTPP